MCGQILREVCVQYFAGSFFCSYFSYNLLLLNFAGKFVSVPIFPVASGGKCVFVPIFPGGKCVLVPIFLLNFAGSL